jgi:hypothetical protein
MRPQQQNRRMRGRNNNGGGGGNNNSNNNNNNNSNNRKGPNPLTRNYESNGPDVKIRGSAQQVAEKYATLARDAQSSGDRVMAENYLQHAEHYNRIIAAAQAQLPIQNVQNNRDDFDDDGDDDRDDFDNGGNNNGADAPVPVVNHGAGPQPVIEGTPAEVALNSEGGRDNRDNSGRDNNGGRHRDRRPSGGYGQNGQRGEFGSRGEQGGTRGDQNRRTEMPVQTETAPAAESISVTEPTLQFENLSPAGLAAQAEANEVAAENGAVRRPKRARRPRVNVDQVDEGGGTETSVVTTEAEASEPVTAVIDT